MRFDTILDTSRPERKAHSACPPHSAAHTTTWMPTCPGGQGSIWQTTRHGRHACLPACLLPSCPMSNSQRPNSEGKRQTSPQTVSEARRRGQPPLSVSPSRNIPFWSQPLATGFPARSSFPRSLCFPSLQRLRELSHSILQPHGLTSTCPRDTQQESEGLPALCASPSAMQGNVDASISSGSP